MGALFGKKVSLRSRHQNSGEVLDFVGLTELRNKMVPDIRLQIKAS
jgi:hypothetical protein